MAFELLNEIKHYNIRPAIPKPDKCALLVIDMQEYFRPIASAIIGNVLSLIKACRLCKIPIFYTRHGHKDISKDGGMLDIWWGDLIHYGTPEWEIIRELLSSKPDIIIDKNRYSVFWGTSLDERLRSLNIEEVIITGVMTN